MIRTRSFVFKILMLVLPATLLVTPCLASEWNIHQFCRENAKAGREEMQIIDSLATDADATDPVLNFLNIGAWDLVQFPSESLRKRVFRIIGRLVPAQFRQSTEFSPKTIDAVDFDVQSVNFKPLRREELHAYIGKYSQADFAEQYAVAAKFGAVLCATYSISNAFTCKNAFRRMLELSAPKMGMALPALYEEVLSDRIAVIGILKVANRVRSLVNGNLIPGTRLFEDFVSVYRKLGANHEEANTRAWKAMGLISTGGPNTADRVEGFGIKTYGVVADALRVISVGSQALDARSIKKGIMYGLPRSVHSTCDSGKPYHFWMPAYLAWESTRHSGNANGSRIAAWLIELGYQLKGSNRDPARPLQFDRYETGNNKIRMDLAYSAAGSAFGAESAKSNSPFLNIDVTLDAMLGEAADVEILSKEKAERLWNDKGGYKGYLRWKKIIAPDSGFDVVAKQARIPR